MQNYQFFLGWEPLESILIAICKYITIFWTIAIMLYIYDPNLLFLQFYNVVNIFPLAQEK